MTETRAYFLKNNKDYLTICIKELALGIRLKRYGIFSILQSNPMRKESLWLDNRELQIMFFLMKKFFNMNKLELVFT